MDLVYPATQGFIERKLNQASKVQFNIRKEYELRGLMDPSRVDYRGKVKFPGGTLK